MNSHNHMRVLLALLTTLTLIITFTGCSELALTDSPEVESQYLGDVAQKSGYLLSAIDIVDPATSPITSHEQEPGTRLIAVEVIVGVSTRDSLYVHPDKAYLQDREGLSYIIEMFGAEDFLEDINIFSGEKVRGWLAFSIPEESIPSKLIFSTNTINYPQINSDGSDELIVSLEEPPDGHEPNTQALLTFPPEPETKLGVAYEKSGYTLTALSLENPAVQGEFSQISDLDHFMSGYKWVAVEVVLRNESGKFTNVVYMDSFLVDSDGYNYIPTVGIAGSRGSFFGNLVDGEEVRGWVYFRIPEDSSPYIFRYYNIFEDIYLMTGLIE